MTAGRRVLALLAAGILGAAIWQVRSIAPPEPVKVAAPVLNTETEDPRVRPVVREASKPLSPVRLVPFDSCTPMLTHLRTRAKPMVRFWGLESTGFGRFGFGGDVVVMPVPARAPASSPGGGDSAGRTGVPAVSAPLAATAGVDYSTTNIQEAGVDEPDLVKTDGRTLYSLSRGRLYAVDVSGAKPRVLGSVGIAGSGHQMLLAGDRAMVFTDEWQGPASAPSDLRSLGHVAVAIVDVSNPAKPYVLDRVRVEGSFVSARLVNGIARVVTTSTPAIRFPEVPINKQADVKAAVRRNQRTLRRAGIDRWLPDFALEHGGRTVASGVVVPCNRVSRPLQFAGIGMTTVLTIDPRNPHPRDASTVNADADVVYATTDHMYVAAKRWFDPQARPDVSLWSTQIHKFDISKPGPARYLASGQVRGHVRKQWALSEHEGFLRVATTDNAVGAVGTPVSESFVIVMQQRGSELVRISAVRGLGKTESIQGVRFIGDTGYVVTWRLIDPFYVIDLRDPWRPKMAGELKMPGFSAYLHPVGKDRILGIGRGGTMEGRVLGARASLFDVSNPAKPTVISQLDLSEAGSSGVEWDHHAFLWWPKTKLAFVPGWPAGVGIRIDDDQLSEVGRVTHDKRASDAMWDAQIQRAVVMRDALLTISNHGLLTSDLRSLAERTWLGWAS